MKNANVSISLKPLGKLFLKFHTTLFFIAIVGGLAFAVLTLNDLLISAADPNRSATTNTTGSTTGFDEVTIGKVKSLHASDSAPTVTLPTGRINPFSE